MPCDFIFPVPSEIRQSLVTFSQEFIFSQGSIYNQTFEKSETDQIMNDEMEKSKKQQEQGSFKNKSYEAVRNDKQQIIEIIKK
jgi:hypothetical protein